MKEKIDRLSKGIFEYRLPEIILSKEVLNIFIGEGDREKGSFTISNADKSVMKGVIYSSSACLKLDKTSFMGTMNEIGYTVIADNLPQGERFEGNIDIVSSCGEIMIPFFISVLSNTCKSSVGHIQNFFSFQSLAQSNWNEALELFDTENLYNAIIKPDPGLRLVYSALKQNPDRNIALEEFLCSYGKKSECSFFVGASDIFKEVTGEPFSEKVVITKNGWGYLAIDVESDKDFITFDRTHITAADFVNQRYELKANVDPALMHEGSNSANIKIYNARHEIYIPVTFFMRGEVFTRKENMQSVKKYISELYEEYLSYKCARYDEDTYFNESSATASALLLQIDKGISLYDRKQSFLFFLKDAVEMYKTYLFIKCRRTLGNEERISSVLLRRNDYERTHHPLLPAILYLEALNADNADFSQRNAEKVRELLLDDFRSGINKIFFIELDRNMRENDTLRYCEILEALEKGPATPALLFEAGVLVNKHPDMLKTGSVSESMIVKFLTDNLLCNREVMDRYIIACRQEAQFSLLQVSVLERLFEVFGDNGVLTLICEECISLKLRDGYYHSFFREAVTRQINMPELYEYYLCTYDRKSSEPIEPSVLMYFCGSSELNTDGMDIIYSYMVRTKEENRTLYASCTGSMFQYTVNCLKAGLISDELAVIYGEVLTRGMLDISFANKLCDILFTYRIIADSDRFEAVLVFNNEEKSPCEYRLNGREADVLLYTDSCKVFLKGTDGNLYRLSEDNVPRKLLHMPDLLANCFDIGADSDRLLLYMWEKNIQYNQGEGSFIDLQKRLLKVSSLKDTVRNECIYRLTDYYYTNYDGELLEQYMKLVDLKMLDPEKRSKILGNMVVRGMYKEVIANVKIFGIEKLSPKRLSKVCLAAIDDRSSDDDRDIILTLAHYAFRNGQIEERLLSYLADRFTGTTLEMFEIWNAAKNAGLDTLKLEENLLAQMLFSESFLENSFAVFRSYYFKNNNRMLIRAFLNFRSYKYFVKDEVVNEEFFNILSADPSLENSDIGILALLKYYSGKDKLSEAEIRFAKSHIGALLQKKLFFAFLQDFRTKFPLPSSLTDKQYIEYKTDPRKSVTIHYSYDRDKGFIKEQMTDVGYGIFSREIILFHGEVLQYFITETDGENEEITESRSIKYYEEAEPKEKMTKYDEINNILVAAEMKDEKTLCDYMSKYYLTQTAISRHFKPL